MRQKGRFLNIPHFQSLNKTKSEKRFREGGFRHGKGGLDWGEVRSLVVRCEEESRPIYRIFLS